MILHHHCTKFFYSGICCFFLNYLSYSTSIIFPLAASTAKSDTSLLTGIVVIVSGLLLVVMLEVSFCLLAFLALSTLFLLVPVLQAVRNKPVVNKNAVILFIVLAF